MRVSFKLLLAAGVIFTHGPVKAEPVATGQIVYASPSGATNGWYSGCVVGAGRSNSSYQVECAGQVWWIIESNIRTTPPPPMPDPMRPGLTITPIITPSAPQSPGVTAQTQLAPALTDADPNGYLATVRRNIARDNAESRPSALAEGKYACYAGGRYTFSDLYITGPNTYRVEPGGTGSFNYADGAITFASGPYAHAYSRMVDGHTIGVSAPGNTNLGTQCQRE